MMQERLSVTGGQRMCLERRDPSSVIHTDAQTEPHFRPRG